MREEKFHKMLKINTLRTFCRPFLGARFGLAGLLGSAAICAGLILAGCAGKEESADSVEFLQMEAARLLKIGVRDGVGVAEIRSIVGRDTLVNRFEFRRPLERVVTLSSSQVGFMSHLGEAGRIVGVSDAKFIVDSAVYHRTSNLEPRTSNLEPVTELGSGPSLDFEKLLALKPDLVMDFATGGGQDDYERINSLRIPLMLTSEWQEESPLAKAEWIKLYGMMFCGAGSDCVGRADSIFKAESAAYKALRDSIGARLAQCDSLDLKTGCLERPRVIAGMSHGGVWYAPGGNSYTAKLISDAGGRYMWAGNSSRELRLSLESVMALADSADVWVNPGAFSNSEEIVAYEPRVGVVKAFREKRVCQNDGRRGPAGGNDFYEGAVSRPAELLYNLSECLHFDPSGASKSPIMGLLPGISVDSSYKWYRNIYYF